MKDLKLALDVSAWVDRVCALWWTCDLFRVLPLTHRLLRQTPITLWSWVGIAGSSQENWLMGRHQKPVFIVISQGTRVIINFKLCKRMQQIKFIRKLCLDRLKSLCKIKIQYDNLVKMYRRKLCESTKPKLHYFISFQWTHLSSWTGNNLAWYHKLGRY